MAVGATNFPTSLDTVTELIEVANLASSTVGVGGVDASATTIPVTSTTAFPATGVAWSGTEAISYTGKTATTLTGAVRGFDGTTAATHAAGDPIYGDIIASAHHEALRGAILALETAVGISSQRVAEYWDFEMDADGSAFGTTITDLFGANTAITTLASTRYEFEALLWWGRTTAGTTIFTFTNTQTYTRIDAQMFKSPAAGMGTNATSLNTSGIEGVTTAAAALPATASETVNTFHTALIKGTFKTNTAGNFRFRVTNSAGAWTLQAGSKFKLWRMASGNIGTFTA
jgi:hypothetical protein